MLEKTINEIKKEMLHLLTEKDLNNKEELLFFERKISTFKRDNIHAILDITYTDFIAIFLRTFENYISYEETINNIKALFPIDAMDENDLPVFLDALADFKKRDMIDYLICKTPSTLLLEQSNLDKQYKLITDVLETLYPKNINKQKEIINFFDKYYKKTISQMNTTIKNSLNIDPSIEKLTIFDCLVYFAGFKLLITDGPINNEFDSEIKKNPQSYTYQYYLENFDGTFELFEVINKFKEYYSILLKETKKLDNILNKKILAYATVLDYLESDDLSIDIPTNELSAINSDIAINVMQIILEYYKGKYEIIRDEYYNAKTNDKTMLEKVLSAHKVNYFSEEEKNIIISNLSITVLDQFLSRIENSKLDFILYDKELLLNTLLSSSKEIISKINYILESNKLPLSFIKNNISIIFDEEKTIDEKLNPLFRRFSKNIELLESEDIDISNIKRFNINVLIMKNEEVKQNIKLVKNYNIDISNPDNYNFSFIEDHNIFTTFDQLLELGLPNINLNFLKIIKKNDYNLPKRFILANMLGIETFNGNEFNPMIINKNSFYLNDDEIDQYISNYSLAYIDKNYKSILDTNKNVEVDYSLKENNILSFLDTNYDCEELVYNINGIRISKLKVLRYLTTLSKYLDIDTDIENILNTIILYESILDYEKVKIILSETSKINEPQKAKVKGPNN